MDLVQENELPFRKALHLLTELIASDAESRFSERTTAEAMEGAMVEGLGVEQGVAHDIAFHLTDWPEEVAFLLMLKLFPERFTQKEIVDGISVFLAHVPNHIAAAAKLYGLPVQDIFGVGPLEGSGPFEE